MDASRTTLAAKTLRIVIPFLALGISSLCRAGDITYYVDQTVCAGGVMGYIVTNGEIGVLYSADILDWNLVLNDGTSTVNIFGPPTAQSFAEVDGTDLSATASQLLFNFSGDQAPDVPESFFDIGWNAGPGFEGLCFAATPNCQSDNGVGEGVGESVMIYPADPQFTSLSGMDVIATAVPEPTNLALLFGGIALLIGFRKLKPGTGLFSK
jgi:hypothetical protein